MLARRVIFFTLLLVTTGSSWSVLPITLSTDGGAEKTPPHLTFVRAFSSVQDVKRDMHPELNRSLDIIAGPKEAQPVTYSMNQPYGVTSDSSHRIYVTDIGAGEVHVFDFVHSHYSLLRGGEHLRTPFGIAADPEGNVYVSDTDLQTILVYDPRGKFTHYIKKRRGNESYFAAPWGIAVDPVMQHIYVCDRLRHMVFILDKKGRILRRIGKRFGGDGPGEFRYPTQVIAAGAEIAVLDLGNLRIQILDAQGQFRKEIKLGYTNNGAGLAMDKEGNFYVTDPLVNQLRIFDHDGQLLYESRKDGSEAGQFDGMSGIWVDSGRCLYIADTHNKRVQLFQITGPDERTAPPNCIGTQ